jgi:hypothetical protein
MKHTQALTYASFFFGIDRYKSVNEPTVFLVELKPLEYAYFQ